MTELERQLLDALRAVVETARPSFPGTPFRKALDNAKTILTIVELPVIGKEGESHEHHA